MYKFVISKWIFGKFVQIFVNRPFLVYKRFKFCKIKWQFRCLFDSIWINGVIWYGCIVNFQDQWPYCIMKHVISMEYHWIYFLFFSGSRLKYVISYKIGNSCFHFLFCVDLGWGGWSWYVRNIFFVFNKVRLRIKTVLWFGRWH